MDDGVELARGGASEGAEYVPARKRQRFSDRVACARPRVVLPKIENLLADFVRSDARGAHFERVERGVPEAPASIQHAVSGPNNGADELCGRAERPDSLRPVHLNAVDLDRRRFVRRDELVEAISIRSDRFPISAAGHGPEDSPGMPSELREGRHGKSSSLGAPLVPFDLGLDPRSAEVERDAERVRAAVPRRGENRLCAPSVEPGGEKPFANVHASSPSPSRGPTSRPKLLFARIDRQAYNIRFALESERRPVPPSESILMPSTSHFPTFVSVLAIALLFASSCGTLDSTDRTSANAAFHELESPPSTFSIVGFDPKTGDLGVAVQSRFFGVGAVVPWVEAGVGAIATQSYANTTYGPRGLELLRRGSAPADVLAQLTGADPRRDLRQAAIVDAKGRAAVFTGDGCHAWAGHRRGTHYSVQGNLLVSRATVDAMARAFETSSGELAERLLRALEAGQAAGGDARGRQSAAIRVARAGGGYGRYDDRYVDLRVEEDDRPIEELRRLVDLRLGRSPLARARRIARSGRPAEGAKELARALDRYPEWADLQLEQARLEFAAGQAATARRTLESWLGRFPARAHAHFRAGEVLAGAGDRDGALAALRRALELQPEYRHVLERESAREESWLHALAEGVGRLLRTEPAGR